MFIYLRKSVFFFNSNGNTSYIFISFLISFDKILLTFILIFLESSKSLKFLQNAFFFLRRSIIDMFSRSFLSDIFFFSPSRKNNRDRKRTLNWKLSIKSWPLAEQLSITEKIRFRQPETDPCLRFSQFDGARYRLYIKKTSR